MYKLQLTRGLQALIDDDDVERVLAQGRWQAVVGYNTWYASTSFKIPGTRKNRKVLLHRFVMNCVEGDGHRVDHLNENGLDCQKHNLRLADASTNAFNRSNLLATNSSGKEGIYWSKQKMKWIGEIIWKGQKIYCGASENIDEIATIRAAIRASLLVGNSVGTALSLRKLTRNPPLKIGDFK